ncbi:MAG: XdhC family protein [Planctomycetes bacterium]|nr:XdhC family protein [Planctomycetota bacterium]HON43968.1 XdhC family protein [Planctomycetota bacterium]HPY73791.1 XdhC family protein [Planctomycetota bacterium]HQA99507.1 XdhC family protein [Planctomycetota bacterium]HRU50572.1 XdhC family protein [Planctomycetota bacterium]
MNHLEIYEQIVKNHDKKKILATVTSAIGSTPRGEGAKMIFFEDGQEFGTIGGGCVEVKTKKTAMDLFQTNDNHVEICINLTGIPGQAEQDVCGGTMKVFLEKI